MHSARRCARWDDAARVARFAIQFYTWMDMRQRGAVMTTLVDDNAVGSYWTQRGQRS
jgi:hypothetical protein